MKKNIISISIMLIAGIIVSIIGTIKQFEVTRFIITLLVSLIIFFIIGKMFEAFLTKTIKGVSETEKQVSINTKK